LSLAWWAKWCTCGIAFPPTRLTPRGWPNSANKKNWVILSGDAFRKANGAERKVLREKKLSVFVLQSSWSIHTYRDKTAQLVQWWPRIVDQSAEVDGIAMEVPWLI